MSITKNLREAVAELRREHPPLFPVRVYRRKIDELGWTELRGNRFVIVLREGMGWELTRQILMHEWAHAVAWREGQETVCDHDPEWGLALSRIYQSLVDL